MWRAAPAGSANPSERSSFGEDVGVVRQLRCRLGSEAIEDHAGPFDVRPQQAEQGIATVQPMQLRDIVERAGLGRQHVRLRIVNHLHAMLDCPQKPVGIAELARGALVEMLRREEGAKASSVAGDADGGITAAVDHLLDLRRRIRPRESRRGRASSHSQGR